MTASQQAPEQLVEECQGLVRSLAGGIHRRVPPAVELDDLIAYGQVGLLEAARDFDASRGGRFSTYAYYRIRGAIYDGLAKMSWFGRGAKREQSPPVAEENEALRDGQGCEADLRWFGEVTRALAMVYLAGKGGADDGESSMGLADPSMPTASSVVMHMEFTQKLHELIDALPPEAATLIRGTYFEGLTLQEVGTRLGVSKSWASRLHAKTLERLAHSLRLQGVTV